MYRDDRDITREIPAYRRMLAEITPSRHAAQVTYTQTLDVSRTLEWIEQQRAETGQKITLLHVFLAAAGRLMHQRPRLNRYVEGSRFYQRSVVRLSLSAKKQLVDGSELVVLFVEPDAEVTPLRICEELTARLAAPRGGEVLRQEKENDLLLKIPGLLLGPLVRLALWLDRRHWLPAALVDPDPMFCSMFVANLGSVGLDVAHHHLYEWGNCPFFAVIGRIDEGRVQVGWTFDERVEDGMACALSLQGLQELIEDPALF
jgi:hypothetical protein